MEGGIVELFDRRVELQQQLNQANTNIRIMELKYKRNNIKLARDDLTNKIIMEKQTIKSIIDELIAINNSIDLYKLLGEWYYSSPYTNIKLHTCKWAGRSSNIGEGLSST